MFHRNVGGLDRTVRIVLGLVLLPAGLVLLATGSSYGLAIAIVGLMALVSGTAGFCGLYVPFGLSTARKRKPAPSQP